MNTSPVTTLPRHYPTTLLETLAQADVWQDQDEEGVEVWRPIEECPVGRALRLLGGLELRASALAFRQMVENEETAEGADVVEREARADEVNAAILANPLGWLRTRPFYVALLSRILGELDLGVRLDLGVIRNRTARGWSVGKDDPFRGPGPDLFAVTTPGELAAKLEAQG